MSIGSPITSPTSAVPRGVPGLTSELLSPRGTPCPEPAAWGQTEDHRGPSRGPEGREQRTEEQSHQHGEHPKTGKWKRRQRRRWWWWWWRRRWILIFL